MFKQRLSHLIIVVINMMFGVNAPAKVPEPDTIFFGTVKHLKDQVLRAGEDDIDVQALLDGALLAVADIDDDGNYLLRIHMDDGEAPRLRGAAQGGDVIHIRIVNHTTKLSFEVNESITNGIPIGEERGIVEFKALSSAHNLKVQSADMDPMADAWELQYSVPAVSGVTPLSLTQDDALMDNDGDGFNNVSEYIAGTNPLEKDSYFRIIDIELTGALYTLKYGPVKAGKQYMVQFKERLTAPEWTTLVRFEAFSDCEYLSWNLDVEDIESGVFRAVVEEK